MIEEPFSHAEKIIDQFFATFDPNPYLFLDVLYRFEANDLAVVLEALEHSHLPKRYASFEDILHEKFTVKLHLGKHDLFICTDQEIYVKRYFQIDVSKEGKERRACGLSPETLEAYKKAFFPHDEYKTRLLELLPFAIESTLNVKKINPLEFRRLFISVLINLTDIVVIEFSEIEKLQEVRGLSLYLLREMFEEMMLYIAEDILKHFANQERKAVEFLSHFGIHETIDSKGNRYKPNPILDESNRAWNMTTIRSTMIQYKKAKQSLFDKQRDLTLLKKKLDSQRQEFKTHEMQLKSQQMILKETEEKAISTRTTIDHLEESTTKEVKFVENGVEKTFERRSLTIQLYRKEDALLHEKNHLQKRVRELELSLANKQKSIYVNERRLSDTQNAVASLESQGHPIDGQYTRICRALAKTLSQR
jgi:hypothetical protein